MRSLADIDWTRWTPTDRATLIFVVEGDRILLIEKKRGLGAGKVNGPGGRIEPRERPLDAALREIEEELGVRATGAIEHGVLSFQFVDGYGLFCHVFRADGCEGEPIETDEAIPLWTAIDAIPFPRMWADDALWLPLLLAGETFRGRFIFEGDRMLDHELVRLGPLPTNGVRSAVEARSRSVP
jgi:8-oxo-dGTP diphosphatase